MNDRCPECGRVLLSSTVLPAKLQDFIRHQAVIFSPPIVHDLCAGEHSPECYGLRLKQRDDLIKDLRSQIETLQQNTHKDDR